MGEVWAAYDVNLACHVAIKVLDETLSENATFMQSFQREMMTLAKFTHPRIVKVKTAGMLTEDGRLYMVMELLRGKTLRELLAERRAQGEVFDYVGAAYHAYQVLDALKAAHEAGFVHRDVKPDNMMVDAEGELKLLDFGVAKGAEVTGPMVRGGEGNGARASTSKSLVLGTAQYVAPEVLLGLGGDERSDLYAVGVVLVLMLTGEYLYAVDTRNEAAVLRAHVEQAPILRREKNPDYKEELWLIARKLVEKEPANRYQTAAEARAALADVLRASLLPSHPSAKNLLEERSEQALRAVYRRAPAAVERASLGKAAVRSAWVPSVVLHPGSQDRTLDVVEATAARAATAAPTGAPTTTARSATPGRAGTSLPTQPATEPRMTS